jgi:hypothetical protein
MDLGSVTVPEILREYAQDDGGLLFCLFTYRASPA